MSILINNAALMGHSVTIAKTTTEEWDNEARILPQFRLLLHKGSMGRYERE